MALHVPRAPGFGQMMKEGARHFQGLEEAVFRNISACKAFAQTLRTAYGPNGMNKMVINHLEKLFVTSDAGTIINELDVEHPAAKLMILASEMQEHEVGDGTNFVIIFCGALLEAAEDLLKMGLTPSEVATGYELALEKALQLLDSIKVGEIADHKDKEAVTKGVRTAVMSKQYGQEDFVTKLIVDACTAILPEKTTFNVDNIRVCKILGSGLYSSQVVNGMVFKRFVEGDVISSNKAKIAVYTCPIDITQTETKGTVLIKTAQELKDYSRGEESLLEGQIQSIAAAGVTVIVSGGKFGDLALHYLNKYGIMAVRLNSKFDVRRICKTVGATALPRMATPTIEELGYADSVFVDEVGDTSVTIFRLDGQESRIATIVVRGATDNFMDDIERAVNDGVNTFKALTRVNQLNVNFSVLWRGFQDGRLLPGAGATEIELARQISTFADTRVGLDQYAVKRFATALEIFPKTLADNTGVNSNDVVTKLYAAHEQGKTNYGLDIEGEGPAILDASAAGIIELYATKYWGLKYAVNAACTILKVDQIIMAKRAGGPKARQGPGSDDES